MDFIDRLLGHDDWANTQLLDLCRGLTDAQLDQTVDVGHESLRSTGIHLIYNVGAWTALMAGTEVDENWSDRSLTKMIERYEDDYATFAAFARQMRDEGRLDDTFIDDYQVKKSMGGTIIHVVEHNLEHRTEMLHILGRLGIPDLPEIDFGAWDYMIENP